MTGHEGTAVPGFLLDHVRFHTDDLGRATAHLVDGYGFRVFATADDGGSRSVALGRGGIRLVVTEGVAEEHPAAVFARRHGDGVAELALTTDDAAAAFAGAVAAGARPVAPPAERDGFTTATVDGFGDVVHTFVQRPAGADPRSLPGFTPVAADASDAPGAPEPAVELNAIDHFAVCLEPGRLAATVAFYEQVLGFRNIFSEHISVGAQKVSSEVVRSAAGDITLTLFEPDVSGEPGQIDQFVKDNGGAGVQHIAFITDDITGTVAELGRRGVEFLGAPEAYYRLLAERLDPDGHTLRELRDLDLLVDADHAGQMFQIFARSVHPRNTFFFEIIERRGATTFGTNNIRALYEAVAAEQAR
jgi:4-hydroxymandelate synthase